MNINWNAIMIAVMWVCAAFAGIATGFIAALIGTLGVFILTQPRIND